MVMNSVSEYIIVLLVEDHPGVTMKIAGMFARRGHNMKSFTGAQSEQKGFSRIVIKTEGSEEKIEQIQKQMNKLIEVVKVQVLQPDKSVIRELALIKLRVKDDLTHQNQIILQAAWKLLPECSNNQAGARSFCWGKRMIP